ncbi:MAG: DUF3097 domain-containing protein [Actinomycetaceae bacterium]|nr:DUF3097 domain-containing protein [Actinomycetaceae bacterium]
MFDRYGGDVLAKQKKPSIPKVVAVPGLVVEDVETGWVGAVVRTAKSGGMHIVELEDRFGKVRAFRLGPGFWVEGKPVELVPGAKRVVSGPPSASGRRVTNSGSVKVEGERARIARASRIWVEGRHDAELVEHIWGDDLRHVGVVVEMLDGIDNLDAALADFQPGQHRRAGILVDHLVKGSKESHIAAKIQQKYAGVLVLGHPFVDVWQAVKPTRVGLKEWPEIDRTTDIKVGTLHALGWPAQTQADIASGWKRILRQVRDYRDIDVTLLGTVERLIDFVTDPATNESD